MRFLLLLGCSRSTVALDRHKARRGWSQGDLSCWLRGQSEFIWIARLRQLSATRAMERLGVEPQGGPAVRGKLEKYFWSLHARERL